MEIDLRFFLRRSANGEEPEMLSYSFVEKPSITTERIDPSFSIDVPSFKAI